MPWRKTRDPYAVWVSEVMLQQTTVKSALPYYKRWMAELPNIAALASASEDKVLALWSGLGYYSRARRLRAGAQQVVREGWPTNRDSWLSIEGIGPYAAAAIASICLGEAVAVVDGNVERVFARFTASDAAGSARRRLAQVWADEVLVRDSPAEWNQAVMELGAMVCRPIQPDCPACPVSSSCRALALGKTAELPVPNKKPQDKIVHETIVVPVWNSRFGTRRRAAGEWWAGLRAFPGASEIPVVGEAVCEVRYRVTNHDVRATVCRAELAEPDARLEWTDSKTLIENGLPSPHRRALLAVIAALGEARR